MMTEPLIEGNFCDDGLGVVLDAVASGKRSLSLLSGELRGVCSQEAQHTCTCVEHFHHKRFKVPYGVVSEFMTEHWEKLQKRKDMVSFVLRSRTNPRLGCIAAATVVTGDVRDAVLRAAADPGIRASALAAILHLLPRSAVFSANARVEDMADTHGETAVNAYKRYLNTGQVTRYFAWQTHILKACYVGLAPLPAELRAEITKYLFHGSA